MSDPLPRYTETLEGAHGFYKFDPSNPLAYGRLSVLFAALDEKNADVCIKVFRDRLAEDNRFDFARELQVMRALTHPYILPLLDWGMAEELDGRPFIVMPLCKRGNLRSLLLARSFIPLDDALRYLRDVAAALDYAHAAGVIHGDVKPENILLLDSDHACLADFGAAKYRLIGWEKTSTTVPGSVTGPFTEMYSSPEQIESGTQSVESDVYSFAMVAFEMLTGMPPVDESEPTYQRMRAKVEGRLRDALAINPSLPKSVAMALARGLSTRPKDRFRRAGELLLAIETSLHGSPAAGTAIVPAPAEADVFVVHGRNDHLKEKVTRFLIKGGVAPIILHEQASGGRTIIEKIEAYASVGAAIVLLTGDDVGALATEPQKPTPRARQNVVFELGFFCGLLGRLKTIALHEPGVELPSDFHGVVYISLDAAGAWRMELVRELRAAGITFDSDALVS